MNNKNRASEDSESESSDIERCAAEAVASLVPSKSRLLYEKANKKFCEWCDAKKVKIVTEKVMLSFFLEKSKNVKSSTLWSEYSKLKCMIYMERKVDISQFHGLIAFLKRKNVGHIAKKAKILTKDDFNKFLLEADDDTFLMMKVVFIFGIAGACRRSELTKLTTKQVIDKGTSLEVDLRDTKNYDPRQFVITEGGSQYNLLAIVRKYMSLLKATTAHDRFFVLYRNGQCFTQPVGINTIGSIPSQIAKFCSLDGPALYTGHSFRRSSATLLADSGANLFVIKKFGGWRSDAVAEGYVESSIESKHKVALKILGENRPNDNAAGINVGHSSSVSVSKVISPNDDVAGTSAAIPNNVIATTSATIATTSGVPTATIATTSAGFSIIDDDDISFDDVDIDSITSTQILNDVTAIGNIINTGITHNSSQALTIVKAPKTAYAMPVMPNIADSSFSNCTFNFYANGKP